MLRLLVAVVLGALIGLERERHNHPAGLRTMSMVSVGSCLFTLLGASLFRGPGEDPTRIAAQIVTGVGFLGAGAILRDGGGIRGLTTAATIWVVAAIGMAAGFGAYVLAIGGTALVLLALLSMRLLRHWLLPRLLQPDEEDERRDSPS